MPPLSRRRLLALGATATLVGTAGCTAAERARLNPFAEPPVSMTVIRASGDETDTTCRLDPEAVAEVPELEGPLEELSDAEADTRLDRGLSIATGREISNLFTRQCDGDVGGLYRYEGAWYLVGLTYRDQAAHEEHHEHLRESETDHHGGTATEADTETPTAD